MLSHNTTKFREGCTVIIIWQSVYLLILPKSKVVMYFFRPLLIAFVGACVHIMENKKLFSFEFKIFYFNKIIKFQFIEIIQCFAMFDILGKGNIKLTLQFQLRSFRWILNLFVNRKNKWKIPWKEIMFKVSYIKIP